MASRIPGLRMQGNEQIATLLYPGFTALDFVGPYHFLTGIPGATIHLVTNQPDLRPLASDVGMAVQPTVTMADCPADLTVIFTPGGTPETARPEIAGLLQMGLQRFVEEAKTLKPMS